MKTKRFYENKIFIILTSLTLSLLTLFVAVYSPTPTKTYALTTKDFEVRIDPCKYAKDHNYVLVQEDNPEWGGADATERTVTVLFRTSKKASTKEINSIKVKHQKGYETKIKLSVSHLTEEETIRTFGVDVEAKVGAVIGKFGGGTKWGDGSSKSTVVECEDVIPASMATGFYVYYARANICEYYLLVYKVCRNVNRDKKGKITGYSNYHSVIDNNMSGTFETFDLSIPVKFVLVPQ